MPRYLFNLADGSVDRDEEGVVLENIGNARKEAVMFAAGTLKDRPDLLWDGGEFSVEVEDMKGRILFVVKVWAVENWHHIDTSPAAES